MLASDLDFDLPDDLIAQEPPAERDGARMAVLARGQRLVAHRRVVDLPRSLVPSLFIVNDSRVLRARLFTTKPSGGRVEILLVDPDGDDVDSPRWSGLARGTKRLAPGSRLSAAEGVHVLVREVRAGGHVAVTLEPPSGMSIAEAIDKAGRMPLPPYIRRDAHAGDDERYQTIFASERGSIAAPTAGLHMTPRLVSALEAEGHRLARVTLHVGPGTFAPLRVEDLDEHTMHEERYVLPDATIAAIAEAKREGRPVIAVGTTSCRTVEGASLEGPLRSGPGRTRIFIRPPYDFRVIDGLLTNFHLPRSTLLALVMALGGEAPVRAAYAECVRERYRFFSYGDAMLLAPPHVLRPLPTSQG